MATIEQLQKRVEKLESQVESLSKNLIKVVTDVVGWHTHAMNGRIYWEYPDSIKNKQIEAVKKSGGR